MLHHLNCSKIRTIEKGFLLIEVVIVAAIITGSLVAILGISAFFLTTSHTLQQTSKATSLAQETLEIVRTIRDGTGWAALPGGGPFYPEQAGSPPEWTLVPGSETIGELTREVAFEEVCRNASDDITPCPASYTDADTIQVISTVSWEERGRIHTVELHSYVTNWQQ